jgi:hypothetical protein
LRLGDAAIGRIMFTRIPSLPHSRASEREKPRIASLLAAYTALPAIPSVPAFEAKLITDALPLFLRWG